MPRTPREMFLTSGFLAAFKQFVNSEAFEGACHYALLQFRFELPPNTQPGMMTDPLVGFDANAQIVGAARVLEILQTLHEAQQTSTPPKRPTLHYASIPNGPSNRDPNRTRDSDH